MRPVRLAAIVVLTLAIGAVAAPAAGQDAKAILVLHAYGYDAPGRTLFDAGFVRGLRDGVSDKFDLYLETLDPNRFGGDVQRQRTRAYLREKYADRSIAVLVAVLDPALMFLLDTRDPLFPDVPIAAWLNRYPETPPDRVTVMWVGNPLVRSLSLALRLHPQTRQIAIVDGAPPDVGRDALHAATDRQIEAMALRVPTIHLRDLSLDELLVRARALPPDTIIFVLRQSIGPGGAPIANDEAIAALARVAPAPMYVSTDPLIGTGAVGGIVVKSEDEGKQLARLALRLAREPTVRIPPGESALMPMFDWRQLRRWGISETSLPAGSTVLFREPSVWDQYKVYIVGAAVILALQSALIAGLVVQGARRRRTERALRESEQRFRASAERNQDLAGRLINAQEAERTRIARDLHDDVSQQLAGLSIMLSSLRRKVGKPGAEPAIDRTFTTLQDRTSGLAQAIRNLSHELHPSVLQHAGLVSTLRRHCADVEELHHLGVTFSAGADVDSLSPDVALCLYRATQEALNNAVRHAHARAIHVELTATTEEVELRIADDGIGFVANERTASGLGLRSIDERARLAHGHVTVDSRPGRGTTVRVHIPLTTSPMALQREP